MRSLRLRFAVVAVPTALVCALAIGIAAQGLFERHVERETLAELDADLRFLARSVVVDHGATSLRVDPLPDPRFQEPRSDLYSQIRSDQSGLTLRSPSRAGFEIRLPEDGLRPGELHRHVMNGPESGKMIVLERLIPNAADPEGAYRVAVAIDRKIVEVANRAFIVDLLPVLAMIAVGLLVSFALQGMVAPHPIARARRSRRDPCRTSRRDRRGASVGTLGTRPRFRRAARRPAPGDDPGLRQSERPRPCPQDPPGAAQRACTSLHISATPRSRVAGGSISTRRDAAPDLASRSRAISPRPMAAISRSMPATSVDCWCG